MNNTNLLEKVLKRERLIVLVSLVALVVASWIYILAGAGMGMTAIEMTTMNNNAAQMMMQPVTWTPIYAVFMFFMWWIMMIAMMVPSASPMILLFAAISRKQQNQGTYVSTGVFVAGYIIVWGGFSVVAVGLQWILERIGLMSSMMIVTNGLFAGSVLVVAGIYQFTPLKQACLRHCKSPIQFVTQHWKTGKIGTLKMGLEHGMYCLGCCWFLMALLFVGGIMNLYWILGLTIFVLLEKVIPAKHRLSPLSAVILIVWGGWMILSVL